ncbi:putative Uncharacterized 50.6 kDa protein in the 5'region of gyrA and gyrB [Streptomyces misionensis JCM 4497]
MGGPERDHRAGEEVQGRPRLRRRPGHPHRADPGPGQLARLRPQRPVQGRPGRPRQRGPPGRLRTRLHRQGDVHGGRPPGERGDPAHPCRRAQPAAPRRPALPGRRRPRHLEPHAQRRARQVQQHRHHPRHRPARQDPAGGQQGALLVPAQVRHRQLHRTALPRGDPRHPRAAAEVVHLAAVHDPFRPGLLHQRRAGRLRVLDHRQRRRTDRADPDPRHQGGRRTVHTRAEAEGDKGRQREDREVGRRDAGVRGGRRTGHRHLGPHPRLQRGRQDRHRQPRGSGHRQVPRLHLVVRRLRPRGQAPHHGLLRHPERHLGRLLRRPDLRTDLQAGHGVRPEDAPGPAHRSAARQPARRLQALIGTEHQEPASDNDHPRTREPERPRALASLRRWCARYAHRRATR